MLEDFMTFLGSFKNVESVSAPLGPHIQVDTGIEAHVRSILDGDRLVLVTGSAGSGKSHLMRSVLHELEQDIRVASPDEKVRGSHLLAVGDATVYEPLDLVDTVRRRSSTRLASLVAINEGPLREAAEIDNSPFAPAVDLLHRGQRGINDPFDPSSPTLIDLGAYDPLANNALAKLLALPLLAEAVDRSPCNCRPHDCPRRLAWQQLQSHTIRERVSRLAQLASIEEEGWLFRDLWDFIWICVRLAHGQQLSVVDQLETFRMPVPEVDARVYPRKGE